MGLITKNDKSQKASLQEITEIGSTIQDIFKNEFLPAEKQLDIEYVTFLMNDGARRGMYIQAEPGYFTLPTDKI